MKTKFVKIQVQGEQNRFYGEEAVGGHMQGLDTDDNAKEALSKVLGNEPSELNSEGQAEKDDSRPEKRNG